MTPTSAMTHNQRIPTLSLSSRDRRRQPIGVERLVIFAQQVIISRLDRHGRIVRRLPPAERAVAGKVHVGTILGGLPFIPAALQASIPVRRIGVHNDAPVGSTIAA